MGRISWVVEEFFLESDLGQGRNEILEVIIWVNIVHSAHCANEFRYRSIAPRGPEITVTWNELRIP